MHEVGSDPDHKLHQRNGSGFLYHLSKNEEMQPGNVGLNQKFRWGKSYRKRRSGMVAERQEEDQKIRKVKKER